MGTRRKGLLFDPRYMQKQAEKGVYYSPEDAFQHIYKTNHWKGPESISGRGSGQDETRELQSELPGLLKKLGVRKLLDAPCGEFGWMGKVAMPGIAYTGADIVPELVSFNQQNVSGKDRCFINLDITRDSLPVADLLFCRDCLVHLCFGDIQNFFHNLKESSITYVMTTTFTDCHSNEDIVTGDWRILNLEMNPFNLPPPAMLINERCTEGDGKFKDKCMGLWRVEDIPRF
ncbi:MAG: hypothetical protein WD266_12765 [Balneolales bacterium]